jgi:NAD(P)-dependent dehydrogenase (short-subunit alcohol dehydrogenase family)
VQQKPLANKTVLITGASRRIGRGLARACADSGADVIVHYRHSRELADETVRSVVESGRSAWALHADFSRAADVSRLAEAAFSIAPVYALVNNAAVFGEAGFADTNLEDWENHLAINLTAPMLLSQAFGRFVGPGGEGRIVNILDWRAARPGADHFAYVVSKAALSAMTRSVAQALAPGISVNGLALGAILPREAGLPDPGLIRRVPAGRWGTLDEVGQALLFLLSGPAYVTGEVIYVDGGRHLI